jgi:hypothetical protein
MGCDYYIIKQLRIEHSNGIDTIELDRKRCYFYETNNESESEGETQYEFQHYLKLTFNPVVLYENYHWKNEKTRDKYIDIIYDKLKHLYDASDTINLIIKEEIRYFNR